MEVVRQAIGTANQQARDVTHSWRQCLVVKHFWPTKDNDCVPAAGFYMRVRFKCPHVQLRHLAASAQGWKRCNRRRQAESSAWKADRSETMT